MLGNDIMEFADIGQGVVFEGLLAEPPPKRLFRFTAGEWETEIPRWRANELPLKALIDSSDRLGIGTEIYTFLDAEAVEPIETWLLRKGVSLPVYYYPTVEELAYDLRFKRSMRTIYVPDQEQAFVIGMRATVVDNKKAWNV